jgi:glucose-6-phosphate isomerase
VFKIKYKTRLKSDFSEFDLKNKLQSFTETINDPNYGFFHLTDNVQYLNLAKDIYNKFKYKKYFVQVGIGGSALGPQMLLDALAETDTNFYFFNNIDSDEIAETLKRLIPDETLFYVVSKSGGTAETIAGLNIAQNWLIQKGVEQRDFSKYFVFCTDPNNGELREFVKKNDYDSLSVPSNIGGRFSVLSHVGLFPALFAGIDIDKLYLGANNIKSSLLNTDVKNNDLLKTAELIFRLYSEHHITQTVLMPYSSKLKSISSWFVQLWAESLGKKTKSNTSKSVGLTPIPAFGATDQHSQVQLFMEGPKDKLLIILGVKNRKNNFDLKSNNTMSACEKLAPYTLNQLMEAELKGTLKALEENDRDYLYLEIEENNEETLASLILFFESLTVIMGNYLDIDPFDQPGVELGKKYAYEWLNSLV